MFTTQLFRSATSYFRVSAARMSTAPIVPLPVKAKPFRIALIQLGDITEDKSHNLKHARDTILETAVGEGSQGRKPHLVVLPVSAEFDSAHSVMWSIALFICVRSASILHTAMSTSPNTRRPSASLLEHHTMSDQVQARVLECYPALLKKLVSG